MIDQNEPGDFRNDKKKLLAAYNKYFMEYKKHHTIKFQNWLTVEDKHTSNERISQFKKPKVETDERKPTRSDPADRIIAFHSEAVNAVVSLFKDEASKFANPEIEKRRFNSRTENQSTKLLDPKDPIWKYIEPKKQENLEFTISEPGDTKNVRVSNYIIETPTHDKNYQGNSHDSNIEQVKPLLASKAKRPDIRISRPKSQSQLSNVNKDIGDLTMVTNFPPGNYNPSL